MIEIVCLYFYAGFSIAVGTAAGPRGRSQGAWLLLALLLSPIMAAAFLFALPRKDTVTDEPVEESPELRERVSRWSRALP